VIPNFGGGVDIKLSRQGKANMYIHTYIHTYLKGITNIDDERIRGGFDREPGAMAMADLQTTH
jgi:hypothetical protein